MNLSVPPPNTDDLFDILPAEPMLLMGAGPVPIAPSVARANSLIINHLGPTMSEVIAQLRLLAQYVFQTESDKIIGVAGPASAAMEMAITNLLWPGRSVLVLDTGTFSHRWSEMSQRVGADVTTLQRSADDIRPYTCAEVIAAFNERHFDVVIATHGETSAGTIMNELEDVASFVHEQQALFVVDAVTTLGALPFSTDAWHVDAVIAGGQKALGSIPGVSLIAFSENAWQVIQERDAPMPHWCLDARLAWGFWGEGAYHYTAPVPGVLALFEALSLICRETLEARFVRHALSSQQLQESIQTIGLSLFVPQEYRLQSVISIKVPQGVPADAVRAHMREVSGVEIAGAFGHDVWRIGQMGEQCVPERRQKTVAALVRALQHYGLDINKDVAMAILR